MGHPGDMLAAGLTALALLPQAVLVYRFGRHREPEAAAVLTVLLMLATFVAGWRLAVVWS